MSDETDLIPVLTPAELQEERRLVNERISELERVVTHLDSNLSRVVRQLPDVTITGPDVICPVPCQATSEAELFDMRIPRPTPQEVDNRGVSPWRRWQ